MMKLNRIFWSIWLRLCKKSCFTRKRLSTCLLGQNRHWLGLRWRTKILVKSLLPTIKHQTFSTTQSRKSAELISTQLCPKSMPNNMTITSWSFTKTSTNKSTLTKDSCLEKISTDTSYQSCSNFKELSAPWVKNFFLSLTLGNLKSDKLRSFA